MKPQKDAARDTARRLAMEYEGRFFDGGAYSAARYDRDRRISTSAPSVRMIEQGRAAYNAMREAHGLPAVTDWSAPPTIRLAEHLKDHA